MAASFVSSAAAGGVPFPLPAWQPQTRIPSIEIRVKLRPRRELGESQRRREWFAKPVVTDRVTGR